MYEWWVYNKFKDYTSKEISEASHTENAWIENEKEHKIIDFSYAFSLKTI